MISVRLDANGEVRVRWPRSDRTVVALGQAYVAREVGLAAGQQVQAPSLALVQSVLAAAVADVTAVSSGEQTRFSAAEQYKQALAGVKERMKTAVLRLKNQYLDQWETLGEWGLTVTNTSRGVSVSLPKKNTDWEPCLNAYIAKEAGLSAETQISDPSLAEMQALADMLVQAKAARAAGRNQRETGVQTRSENAARLRDLLQVAALVITVTQNDGQTRNNLQEWGFDVVARTPAAPQQD